MHPMRNVLLASTLAFTLMGAGCASSTTTNANVTTTNASNSNTSAAGTVLENSNANVGADDTTSAVVDTNTEETVANINATTEAETKTFDVVASQSKFTPSTITVNQGDTVVLNLTSADVPHGFSLPDFNVSETITPGKTKTVQFVADQAGSFSFSCSVVCGAGHANMRGTLVVN